MTSKKITLDTNCLIDVEKKRSSEGDYTYKDVLGIVNRNGKDLEVATVAASASDMRINREKVDNINKYFLWLESIGLNNLKVLKPLSYYGISFWGHCLWADGKMIKLDEDIQTAIFPDMQSKPGSNQEIWLNNKHDVIIMWGHIWHDQDIFVTRDKHFLNNEQELINLGAKKIVHPRDFAKLEERKRGLINYLRRAG